MGKKEKVATEADYLQVGKCQNNKLKELEVVSCRVVEMGKRGIWRTAILCNNFVELI